MLNAKSVVGQSLRIAFTVRELNTLAVFVVDTGDSKLDEIYTTSP